MKISEEDRRRGSLVVQAIGDALGFLVEGHSPEICSYFVDQTFNGEELPSAFGKTLGQYSDDTQLARELACSLVYYRNWVPQDFARRVAAIFAEDRIVGRGRATQAAANRLIAGASWDESGEPSPSAGNGAAMRVSPVGLFFRDPKRRRQVADEQARVTHLDLRSRAAAILIADAVADALTQPTASLEVGSPQWCEMLAHPIESIDPPLAAAMRTIPRWLTLDPTSAAAEIARVGEVPHSTAHNFEKWHGISPFATPSAIFAVYSYARTPTDPVTVLRTAIAAGGDVDTVAAMAGAIVGARVGLSLIGPRLTNWANVLSDRGTWTAKDLAELAAQSFPA